MFFDSSCSRSHLIILLCTSHCWRRQSCHTLAAIQARCMSVAASGQVAGTFMTMPAAIVAATLACACSALLGSLQQD